MKPPKKVTPGMHHGASPLKSANFINHLIDMVNWWKHGGASRGSNHQLIRGQLNRSSGIVYIQNQTGAARNKGDVVQVGNYLFSEPNDRAFWFAGETPEDPADQRFAILEEPADTGTWMFAARVSGRAWANVNVVSTEHGYATPEAGQHVLKSAATGPVQLIHTPTSTGPQMLPVLLASSAQPPVKLGKTDAAHSINTSGTVSIWTGTPGSETDSGENVEAYNRFGDFEANQFVLVVDTPDGSYIIGPAEDVGNVVEFELTATLTLGSGSTAAAKIVQTEEAIVVEDTTQGDGEHSGAIGFRGFAVKPEGATNYHIISMEQWSRWITGTLAENMGATTTGEAKADNITGTGGRSPVSSPSDEITVYDPRGLFKYALNDAKFTALRNLKEDRYEVIACQQRAMWISFKVSGTVAVTTPSFTGTTVAVLDGGQSPGTSVTIYNVASTKTPGNHVHTGQNNYYGEAHWSPAANSGNGGYRCDFIEC